jgi:hypothetical protein
MKLSALIAALGTALMIGAGAASAATIGVKYSGVVTSVDPDLAGQFSVGDTFTFDIAVDKATPDGDANPEFGSYYGITKFKGSFSSGYTFTANPGNVLYVYDTPLLDEVQFGAGSFSTGDIGAYSLFIAAAFFADPTLTMLSSDAIPNDLASLLSLSADRTMGLNFLKGPDLYNVFGTITAATAVTQTPIPAALPLFASALGGLSFFAWRRRRRA